MALINKCICGGTEFQLYKRHHMQLASCRHCNVIHQHLNMDEKQYFEFYEKEYPENFQNLHKRPTYKSRYDHDREIAGMRFSKYETFIPIKGRTLDIGASNGAFVDAARERGYDAYGVDFNASDTIYKGPVERVNFPTEYFDVVTLHDVLEHLIDPAKSLKEIRRIVKPGGRIIIDFPNFFDECGKHHWKPIEHLWYLDKKQLIAFLEQEGLGVTEVDQPIPSKFVFYCYNMKSVVSKTKILVLPGMGDIYWTLTKFQSFIDSKKIVLPEVYIWNFDGRPRSHEFLQRFPFLKSMGYWNHPVDNSVLNTTYITGKEWVIPKYKEFDYYLSVNGVLTDGKSLETIPMQTNWYVPMFESLEQRDFGKEFKEKHGDYIVSFFSELGMFQEWIKEIPITEVYTMMKEINKLTKRKIVLTGCDWDADFNKKLMMMDKKSKIFIDLVGKTTNDQFFGLIKESKGFIGWCGGNTVMSVVFKIPTIIFWSNKHFKNEGFYTNCCPPDGVGKWYFPQVAERYDRAEVLAIAGKIFK